MNPESHEVPKSDAFHGGNWIVEWDFGMPGGNVLPKMRNSLATGKRKIGG